MSRNRKLLIVQIAALGWDLVESHGGVDLCGLQFRPTQTVFPAVTCSVQGSFRTATQPEQHGMTANGMFDRRLRKAFFWEQSAAQVEGQRMWQNFRSDGGTVGMLFWQQSLGENVDLLLSPAPIHRHHGGMIQDCYARPAELYHDLCSGLGRRFNLMHYWGPTASYRSSQWIAEATCAVLRDRPDAPDLCFSYLPVLDYDLQRHGPDSPRCGRAWRHLVDQLGLLSTCAKAQGYEIVVYGDYAIAPCPSGPAYPNRALRAAGLLSLREVRGMLYPDLCANRAFALTDHEIAHIHVPAGADISAVRDTLLAQPGIGRVLDRDEQVAAGVAHANSGELVAIAENGYWMSYKWWQDASEAPEYASHVDIHNKPGFDPCELFFGWPPGSISANDDRVMGSHGKAGKDRRVAWASSFLESEPDSLVELAGQLRTWLGESA